MKTSSKWSMAKFGSKVENELRLELDEINTFGSSLLQYRTDDINSTIKTGIEQTLHPDQALTMKTISLVSNIGLSLTHPMTYLGSEWTDLKNGVVNEYKSAKNGFISYLNADRITRSQMDAKGVEYLLKTGLKFMFLKSVGGLLGDELGAEEELTHLPPSELEVTHPRTMGRRAFGRLVKDIKENGVNETVKIVEHDGKNYVVDGNHRTVAARSLGLDSIPIEKVELPYLGYKTIEDFDFFSPGLSQ